MKVPRTAAAAALEQVSKSTEETGPAAEGDMESNNEAGETKNSQTNLLSTLSRVADEDKVGKGKECDSGSDSDSDTDSDGEHDDLSEKLSKIIGDTSQENLIQGRNTEPVLKGEDEVNEANAEKCTENLDGDAIEKTEDGKTGGETNVKQSGKRKKFSMVMKPKEAAPTKDTKKGGAAKILSTNKLSSSSDKVTKAATEKASDAEGKEKKGSSAEKEHVGDGNRNITKESKPARARSAFIFFTMENREKVKAQNGKLSLPEMQKKLAEAWKELGDEQRQRYEGMAAADKIRVEAEKKVGNNDGGEKKGKSATGKQDKGTKKVRAKTSYMIFCSKNRERIQKAASPGATFGELTKALAEEWKSLSDGDKKEYEELAAEDRKRVAELVEDNPGSVSTHNSEKVKDKGDNRKQNLFKKTGKSEEKVVKAKKAAVAETTKAKKKGPTRTKKSAASEERKSSTESTISDEMFMGDEESENEDADPMEEVASEEDFGELQFILGKTRDGKYVTKRKGMDYTQVEYENFPAKKAKLNPEQEAELEEKVKEYHKASAAFKKEVDRRLAEGDGNLDLEGVPKGSKLEMLTFLGNIREDVFPEKTLPKPDVWMKVPMLGTYRLLQKLEGLPFESTF
ncbi:High mobility group [Klebsormidium nitens]|uniref:High mobility group n=1 Tax=Klebsormidium nitens TaxID=105231 RepID=A0A1Y1HJG7_KLENI|nr:High mobility group [Klebsormidium nitens]|eukprot:GAQ78043.1 High mobility group [Klebsormidium nitens]